LSSPKPSAAYIKDLENDGWRVVVTSTVEQGAFTQLQKERLFIQLTYMETDKSLAMNVIHSEERLIMEYRYLGRTGVRVSPLCFGDNDLRQGSRRGGVRGYFPRLPRSRDQLFRLRGHVPGRPGRGNPRPADPGLPGRSRHHEQGFLPDRAGPQCPRRPRGFIFRLAVEASLRRLQTGPDRRLFIHRFDERTPLEETLRVLDDLVRREKFSIPG